mmetsp:Transcript_33525/g.49993  ORF Transcript_33525/g.49993 Transcript_33525/m.49993 type:complete len:81 (+) Transcript_33525:211-453(+)
MCTPAFFGCSASYTIWMHLLFSHSRGCRYSVTLQSKTHPSIRIPTLAASFLSLNLFPVSFDATMNQSPTSHLLRRFFREG